MSVNLINNDTVPDWDAAFRDVDPEENYYNNLFPYAARLLLLSLLKKIGNARPGEGDWHPISPKTPAPHYQPIEEKKRKGK